MPSPVRRAVPWAAALLVTAVTLWMRAPTWNDRILFIDEAIGVSYGQRLQLPGASVYTHTPDMKPPLGPMTYLAAVTLSPAHAIAVVHVFTTAALAVTALLLLYAAVHFADSATAGVVAAVLYLLSTAVFAGFEPQFAFSSYDHFMAPWLVGAACAFLLALERGRARAALAAGALLGVAGLYKQNAPVLLVPMAVLAWRAARRGHMSGARAAVLAAVAGLACAAVILSAPAYYALRGQFAAWWFFNVVSLRRYSSIASGLTWTARARVLLAALPMPRLATGAALLGLVALLRRGRRPGSAAWSALALLCWVTLLLSLIPGQAKAHYVLQVLPFQCALIGLLPVELWRSRAAVSGVARPLVAAASVALGLAIGLAGRDLYQWRALLLQFIAQDQYLQTHRSAGTLEPVVDYLRAHSQPDDLLYVAGGAPELYVLAQRRPAASDTFQGWFVWPWGLEAAPRLLDELRVARPRYIVQLGYMRYSSAPLLLDPMPGFCAWLYANYRERVVADRAQVLERIDQPGAPPSGAEIAVSALPTVDCTQRGWRRVDRSAAGTALSVAGVPRARGLGVRAPASLTYVLSPDVRRFAAEVGVDDASTDGDAVRFHVEVDHTPRFDQLVARGAPPITVDLDIAGASTLTLTAEPAADEMKRASYADWIEPRVLR
jgi:hypothetical protein